MHLDLDIRCVEKRFGAHLAVRDVSLSVEPGSIVGLLGPNGAGKSTTLRLALGLAAPTSGSVMILGASPDPSMLRRVGVIFEEPAFYPWMKAERFLQAQMAASGERLSAAEIETAMSNVGLRSSGRRIASFSLGMRQRLALAAALAHRPQLLVLDEPTNGLDPEGVVLLREILLAHRDRGGSVLMSSHLLTEVEHVCGHVYILVDGRIADRVDMSKGFIGAPELVVRFATGQSQNVDGILGEHVAQHRGNDRVVIRGLGVRELVERCPAGTLDPLAIEPVGKGLEAHYLRLLDESNPS